MSTNLLKRLEPPEIFAFFRPIFRKTSLMTDPNLLKALFSSLKDFLTFPTSSNVNCILSQPKPFSLFNQLKDPNLLKPSFGLGSYENDI